jgi:hypothetical protein
MGFARESQLKADPEVYDAISKLKPDQFTDVFLSTTTQRRDTRSPVMRSTS